MAEPFDLLLVFDALRDVFSERPQAVFAFVACHPKGSAFHGQYFRVEGQRVVEDETFALASFGYGRFYSVPLFLAACVRVHLIDFQLGDVICQSDVVVLPEEAVGKYEGSVFVGGKDVFGGVVDGMRQQGDVIAPLLDIGDVLYVSFEDCVSTGAFLAGEGLLADIEHFLPEVDAILHAFFHVSLQVLVEPFAEYLPVFGQYVCYVAVE